MRQKRLTEIQVVEEGQTLTRVTSYRHCEIRPCGARLVLVALGFASSNTL